jgi:cobalamin biosynthesis Mg chelatase CobN
MLLDSSTLSTSFGGTSPTFAALELRLDSEAFGKYATTEFGRLPSSLAYARGGSDDVVTAVRVDAPDNAKNATGRMTVALKRDALDEQNASVDGLQVERYDDSAGEWRTLDAEVTESNNDTVTLRTESSRLGWFVVSSDESAQTASTTATATATATSTEAPTTAASSASTEEAATGGEQAETATETTQPATTQTGTPGFGVFTVVLAATTLLGYLRFRRR